MFIRRNGWANFRSNYSDVVFLPPEVVALSRVHARAPCDVPMRVPPGCQQVFLVMPADARKQAAKIGRRPAPDDVCVDPALPLRLLMCMLFGVKPDPFR